MSVKRHFKGVLCHATVPFCEVCQSLNSGSSSKSKCQNSFAIMIRVSACVSLCAQSAYVTHVPSTLLPAVWKVLLNAQTSPWSVAEGLHYTKPVPREWRLLIARGRQPAFRAEIVGTVKVRREVVGCVLMYADCGTGRDKAAVDDFAAFGDKAAQARWRW